MRRIGILGGTFNPIHYGHLTLGEWARDALELDQVWIIPTGVSYMKDQGEIVSAGDRLHMAELAVCDNAGFQCLDIEIRQKGHTYSYETLERLKAMYPEDELYFIVGADCLFTIETWKNPEQLLQSCILVAAVRENVDLSEMRSKKEDLEKRFHGKVILLPFLKMSLSSTEIRQRIRQGKSVRYLIPEKVLLYIEEKGLYREENR